MAVTDQEVIDYVAVSKESGEVVLTISDHLEWELPGRLAVLQGKLNTYLAFIESGEVFERYPEAEGKPCKINVVLKHAPDKRGEKFLKMCADEIAKTEIAFAYEVYAMG